MNIDIKHKHASHVIIIEGQAFKANDSGMWDLTDIWRTLKLPKSKQPGQWNNLKEGQYMREMGFSHSAKTGAVTATHANKRATLSYAGWVSREFETVVYDAFEAILEMPEVALLVAEKMRSLGNDHSAAILERTTENQDRNAILRRFNRGRKHRTLTPDEKAAKSADRSAKAYERANPMR